MMPTFKEELPLLSKIYKIQKVNPEKYLVGKNGEIPELPFWVLDAVPIGKIKSGKGFQID